MARKFLLSGILLSLAACDGNVPAESRETPDMGDASAASAGATQLAADETTAAKGRSEKDSNEVYEFEYAYPDEAAAYPGLKDLLDQRLADARSELAAEAKKGKKEAESGGFPYHAHSSGTVWKVVAQTPRFLSLSAEIYAYMGGAHGMTTFDTLLWDKQSKIARQPADLFTAPQTLGSAIQEPFCKALDRERAKKRGSFQPQGDDMFSNCIDPMESTIILGSTDGEAFDRIGVLVEPYAAGPYAEGSYDTTVPVTRAVLDAVKPAYRDAFALAK